MLDNNKDMHGYVRGNDLRPSKEVQSMIWLILGRKITHKTKIHMGRVGSSTFILKY